MKCPLCGEDLEELIMEARGFDKKRRKLYEVVSKGYYCEKCGIMIQIQKLPKELRGGRR